jgi:acetyl-CoA carboxylase biotin carboxyl carrier protein
MVHMTDLSHDDVAGILRHLEASPFAYLRIETGDITIVASKTSIPDGVAPASTGAPPPVEAPGAGPVPPAPAAAAAPTPDSGAAPPVAADDDAGLLPVTAPMVGTFYTAPSPGAADFVTVGQAVHQGDPLALVEAMKMFNAVEVAVDGTIERRLVESGDFVEYGQTLFLLRPTAGTPPR